MTDVTFVLATAVAAVALKVALRRARRRAEMWLDAKLTEPLPHRTRLGRRTYYSRRDVATLYNLSGPWSALEIELPPLGMRRLVRRLEAGSVTSCELARRAECR